MHSQNLEEKIILDYFGDYVGTFLDLGCNNGETFSNTRALALKGWKGVLVDASPKAIERCRELYKGRKGIYIYDYAITGHMGKEIFHESSSLISSRDVGLVSTFHDSEMSRFKSTVSYTPIEVKTLKWKTALNRWQIKQFQMMSIDIEGDELNVLPDMDLSEVRLICIEWNSKEDLKKEYLHYTSKYGLDKIIYTSAENLIIVR